MRKMEASQGISTFPPSRISKMRQTNSQLIKYGKVRAAQQILRGEEQLRNFWDLIVS